MLHKFLHYLNPLSMFKKSTGESNINLKMMHGINRISILMFLVGLVIVLMKIFK